jgi:hypothetical protein
MEKILRKIIFETKEGRKLEPKIKMVAPTIASDNRQSMYEITVMDTERADAASAKIRGVSYSPNQGMPYASFVSG